MNRSFSLKLFCQDEKQYVPVRDSIKRYRASLRGIYAALACAQQAASRIEISEEDLRVVPDSDNAVQILEKMFGKTGKALGYQCRDWFLKELYPNAMSFVWDSARRDLVTAWTSKDPEHTKVTRGWLLLQGGRGFSRFMHRGIGFPQATARPKFDKHGLILKWDRGIDSVTFKIEKLDPGRWFTWKQLVDEENGYKAGTVFLNEQDGQLKVVITYSKPDVDRSASDKIATCAVSQELDTLFALNGPNQEGDTISGANARAFLLRASKIRAALEARKAACGNPKRPWGHRKGWRANVDVLARNTLWRTRAQTDFNHAWSRRIADRVQTWGVGIVQVSLPEKSELYSLPWAWSQFKDFLKYKLEERGIALKIQAHPQA